MLLNFSVQMYSTKVGQIAVAYSRNSVVVNPLSNLSLHIFPLVFGCCRVQFYTRLCQRPALQDAEEQRVVEELEDHDPKIEDTTDHNRRKVVAPTLKKILPLGYLAHPL